VAPGVAEYAWKAGLFVLELSGDSARLASAPSEFKPREW
jgi:hypothetical protein